jgi:hypothetical protein
VSFDRAAGSSFWVLIYATYLGAYWDFYDHHLPLTHNSLFEGLAIHGFIVDLIIDRFLPYTTKSSLPAHPWLISLYFKMPFVWPIFGRQFFVVARKEIDVPGAADRDKSGLTIEDDGSRPATGDAR